MCGGPTLYPKPNAHPHTHDLPHAFPNPLLKQKSRTGEHEPVLVVARARGVEEHGVHLLPVALQPVHHHLLLYYGGVGGVGVGGGGRGWRSQEVCGLGGVGRLDRTEGRQSLSQSANQCGGDKDPPQYEKQTDSRTEGSIVAACSRDRGLYCGCMHACMHACKGLSARAHLAVVDDGVLVRAARHHDARVRLTCVCG